jgi:hypothetical protein
MYKNLLTVALTALVFLAISFVACKQKEETPKPDKCTGITCENGGMCVDGNCTCARGYEGYKCEKRWLSRYLGNWEITETVAASSDLTRKGLVKKYIASIKEKDNNPTRFFIDDFMGNPAYDGVSCDIALNNNGGYENSLHYIFTKFQSVAGSYVSIRKGEGTVNESGSVMFGEYHRTDIIDSVLTTDTVTFSAIFEQ